MFKITSAVLFVILGLSSLSFAEEEITITTYYPSPYGSYNELTTYSNTYLATDSAGNVGIGTTGPSAKLHIKSDTTSSLGQVILQSSNNDSATSGTKISWYNANSSEVASIQAVNNAGDGIITFNNLVPWTGPMTERMRIDRTGNVGIGTNSPTQKLEIVGPTGTIQFDLNSYSGYTVLRSNPINNALGHGELAINAEYNGDWLTLYGDQGIQLRSPLADPAMTIIRSGNVGIGTESPNYKFEVSGDIKANSLINLGGAARPSCSSANRGQQFLLQSGAGTEDGFYICKKKADSSYDWTALGSPIVEGPFEVTGSLPGVHHSLCGNIAAMTTMGTVTIPSNAKQVICTISKEATPPWSCFTIVALYNGNIMMATNGNNISRQWSAEGGGTVEIKGSRSSTSGGVYLYSTTYYIK